MLILQKMIRLGVTTITNIIGGRNWTRTRWAVFYVQALLQDIIDYREQSTIKKEFKFNSIIFLIKETRRNNEEQCIFIKMFFFILLLIALHM